MPATGSLLVKDANSANQTISTLAPSPGLGSLTAVPAGSANGTALGTPPTAMAGARFYLPSGTSVSFTVASTAPSAPPTTFTISQSTTGPNWDENLNGTMLYVTAIVGVPLFRWY